MLNPKTKILLYSSVLWYLADGMLGPLYALYAQKVGGKRNEIMLAWVFYVLIKGLFTYVVGKWSDEMIAVGRERTVAVLMIVGYMLNAGSMFAYIWAWNPLRVFAIQILIGISAALSSPTFKVLYTRSAGYDHAGVAWGGL